ncbi:MAG: hypothetical protein JSU89_15675 [Myxococcales bacterium]|nr:MAG: hypothetical protein JSU89_15675 [Myxococcales bacterium]
MAELRTDLIIAADTKGFSQAAQEAERLSATANRATADQVKGYQAAQEEIAGIGQAAKAAVGEQGSAVADARKSLEQYQAEIRRLQEALGELKSSQLATVQSLMQVQKGSEEYKRLQKQLGDTNETMRLTETALRGLNEAVLADDGAAEAADKLVAGYSKAKTSQRQYRQEIQALKRELQGLAQEQAAVAQALGKTERGSAAYQVLSRRLQDTSEKSRTTETRIRAIERATGRGMPLTERDMAKGAFWQGLMQGAFPGMGMIQRGPGMQQQMMGAMMGRAGRGVVAGAFGGVRGLQQMIGAAPVPGAGVLAAQVGTGLGFAGGGLQQMQARLRALPMMGGVQELGERIAAARGRAGRRARETYAPTPMAPEAIEAEARAAAERVRGERMPELEAKMRRAEDQTRLERETSRGTVRAMSRREYEIEEEIGRMQRHREQTLRTEREARTQELLSGITGEPTATQRRAMEMKARKEQEILERTRKPEVERRMREIVEADVQRKYEGRERDQIEAEAEAAATAMRRDLERPERQRRAAMAAAARAERRAIFRPVRRAGAELAGLPEQQAIQMLQAVTQRGGGGIQDLQQQGMLRAAFAAQTAYGLGPEVTGAFQMGGRRGAMVGARGQAGELMAQTIGDALGMGLEGWEATEYMQQMASGIDAFKQTGIPINPRSIGKLGQEFAQTGVGGLRGGIMGRGLMQGLQRISTEGVRGGVDLLAAQVFGGFEGGGLGNWWEMQKRLEAGGGEEGFSTEQIREFIQRATEAGGGGVGGMMSLREVMRQMGVQMTAAETEQLARGAMAPGEMTQEQQQRFAEVRQQMAAGARAAPRGVADLEQDARTMMDTFGKEIRRTAALQNKQNDIGEKLVPVFNNLQSSAANINSIFANLADDSLIKFSKGAEELSKKMVKLADSLDRAESSEALSILGKLVTFM